MKNIAIMCLLLALSTGCCSQTPTWVTFPLHDAALAGNLSEVTALLEKGDDVDVKAASGATALFFAAYEGHLEVVKLLLEKGADVNAKDLRGKTALMWAVQKGRTEIADLLRRHGAKE